MKSHHIRGVSRYIKDLVYGANDGIITTFAVVTGSIGAGFDSRVIIVLGVANLFADGISMGVSNYLGERSENSVYKKEKQKEYEEVAQKPEIEKEEIMQICSQQGFSSEEAKTMAKIICTNEKFWVDFMMKYELGLEDPTWGSEWKGATITFFAFVIAGTLPLLSFFFAAPENMFRLSVVATATAFFVVGSLRYFITKRNWLLSGLEMLVVGGIAAGVSYGVGYAVSLII